MQGGRVPPQMQRLRPWAEVMAFILAMVGQAPRRSVEESLHDPQARRPQARMVALGPHRAGGSQKPPRRPWGTPACRRQRRAPDGSLRRRYATWAVYRGVRAVG